MKRKRLDRAAWTTIIKKRYVQKKLPGGVAAAVYLDEVSRVSTWKFKGYDMTVCEAGLIWLTYAPYSGESVMTAMIGAEGARLWYIDAAAGMGFFPDGVAWYDDAYLDLIITRRGDALIDDMDELEAAVKSGEISKAHAARAKQTIAEFPRDVNELLAITRALAAELGMEGVNI